MHVIHLMARAAITSLKIGPEDSMAIEFANQIRVWSIEGHLRAVWTHVPNELAGSGGGHADPEIRKRLARLAQIRYAIAKALGMIPGCPDYLFLWQSGSGVLEAKAPGKKQGPDQKNYQKWCEDHGVPYEIFENPEQGYAILRRWGILVGK